MLLSVITITFNDPPGLSRTRDSLADLLSQGVGQVEWLIQDGGSNYDVGACVPQNSTVKMVSEADHGLYDAMNRALSRASGEWVWMLNGGDECLENDWRRLKADLEASPGQILLFDYDQVISESVHHRTARRWSDMWHALPTSHQAMFFPTRASQAIGYSTQHLSADYRHAALLLRAGVTARRVARPIARFHTGGRSTMEIRQVARDAKAVQRDILESPRPQIVASQLRHALARARLRILIRKQDHHG